MHALVITPIPSDPSDQGNAARIGRICELMQYFGYSIHFLYYGMEGLTPQSEAKMRARWEYFHFVRVESAKRQSRLDGYDVDDYYGAEVGRKILELQKVWSFDVAVVNYVWMSAALEVVSKQTLKFVDTHDVFGERQYILQQDRVAPTWFYCSAEEERRGLDRADVVIAIQSEEAKVMRERTCRPVETIGHILPQNFRPQRSVGAGKLRVGYLASGNPSNRKSLDALVEAAQNHPTILERFEFLIGGAVGRYLPPTGGGFIATGFVDDPLDFYDSVDVVLNPNISGTGLKIKSIEALSHGLPFISTIGGMIGIRSERPEHRCESVSELMSHLERMTDPVVRQELRTACKEIFVAYTQEQLDAFERALSQRAGVVEREGAAI